MKKTDYTIFKKYVLFMAEAYLRNGIKEGYTDEAEHKQIVAGIDKYLVFGRFNKKQFQKVKAFEDQSALIAEVNSEGFSHVIYALQLLKRYVIDIPPEARKGITIGVSNTKLKKGRAYVAIQMLKLKLSDKKKYEELSKLIDTSINYADRVFDEAKKELTK